MSDREQPRDLTPPTAGRWKVVGLELAHRCTFCGRPSSATVNRRARLPMNGGYWRAGLWPLQRPSLPFEKREHWTCLSKLMCYLHLSAGHSF
jgi:hypothetical protein